MNTADTAIAVLLSIPLGVPATRNISPHPPVHQATRSSLDALRSIPKLIMGTLFVAAVGFGALSGVLALGLHLVGMIAELPSKSIEHAGPTPIETAHAAGYTPLQMIFHRASPQMLP